MKFLKPLATVILIFAFAFSANLSLAQAKAEQKVIKWTGCSAWAPTDPHHWVAVRWAERVEKLSGGRIKIKLFSGGQTVPPFEVRQAVEAGSMDYAHAWSGFYMAKDMSNLLLASTPAFLDNHGYLIWLSGAGGLEFMQELVGDKLKVFCAGLIPSEMGVYTQIEINKLSDLKGLKLRGPLHMVDVFKKFGATGVFIPPGEIVTAFRTGVVDACEYSNPSSDVAIGIHEAAKFQYLPSLQQTGHTVELVLSKKRWDELTPDLQEIVKVALQAEVFADYPKWFFDDMKNIKIIQSKTKVRSFSPEIQNAMITAYIENFEKYAKENKRFDKIWSHMKKFMVEYYNYIDILSPVWQDKAKWIKQWSGK
jgi:TRAP-type mannitol/chloroaromatic compound transport system substrate-binding protein